MIDIRKGKTPKLLAVYRRQLCACWDGPAMEDGTTFTEVKASIREHLWAEQHGLCAYCMCRIPKDSAGLSCKIEHFKPRSRYSENELDYGNLLLCCNGNNHERTCDTKKGDMELQALPNPAKGVVLFSSSIWYKSDGAIGGKAEWQSDIDDILNLNCETLKRNRRAAKTAFFRSHKSKASWSPAALNRELDRLMDPATTQWPAYAGYLAFLIKKKIRSNASPA